MKTIINIILTSLVYIKASLAIPPLYDPLALHKSDIGKLVQPYDPLIYYLIYDNDLKCLIAKNEK